VGVSPNRRVWQSVGYGLAVLAGLWAAATYFSLRASGVTGSDPYAYVQMAVDLARHGTLLHTFPLAPQIAAWHLPTWPAVPVGYRPPDMLTGQAATVWAPGYTAFLAVAYQMAGEAGLYLLPPLMGCLALAALWALCLEVLRTWPVERRYLAAGLAVLVLATSYRQLEGAVLPMADIPSQLFTLLAVYGAFRATRAGEGPKAGLIWAALSGLCLAVAFSIRYTQVLLAVSLVFLLGSFLRPVGASWRARALRLFSFGLAAWLGALPVFWYHTLAFGHPFAVGSAELGLFGWAYVPATALALAQELLRTNEFLYLVPFLLWGLVRLGRGFERELTALILWLGVLVAFHLPYPALRARDLLSVFPVFALLMGAGAADVLAWTFTSGRIAAKLPEARKFLLSLPRGETAGQPAATDRGFKLPHCLHPERALQAQDLVAPAETLRFAQRDGTILSLTLKFLTRFLVLGTVVLLFGARVRVTLQWPLHAGQFNTFGYLDARQRAAFDEIRRLTPPEAILAASLNSGALNVYSQREAVRPADWSTDDWRRFVPLALEKGQAVYLLVDGEEMQAPKQALEPAYTLKPVAALPLPYFYPDGSSDNRPVELYQISR
jgi:hypothetical protein